MQLFLKKQKPKKTGNSSPGNESFPSRDLGPGAEEVGTGRGAVEGALAGGRPVGEASGCGIYPWCPVAVCAQGTADLLLF